MDQPLKKELGVIVGVEVVVGAFAGGLGLDVE